MGSCDLMEKDQTSTITQREGGFKTSTADVPMADLEETLALVREIHERGLENATMPEVARGTGFAHASSTPFARKIAAARHFGLLGPRRAELTELAHQYLRPTEEGAARNALRAAIYSVPEYVRLIEQYENKKVNHMMLKNWFAKKFSLQDHAASVCARSFVQSLRFGGLIAADEILRSGVTLEDSVGQKSQDPVRQVPIEENSNVGPGEQRFVLPLDRSGTRKFVAISPSTITSTELKRIQDWLSFQLIVEDVQPES
jgi:hypothetical protein